MSRLTDEQREQDVRAALGINPTHSVWPEDVQALLRLLDAERARADAAEASKADVWSEGWGAAGDAFMEGLLAEASGDALPQSDGPPNPYR